MNSTPLDSGPDRQAPRLLTISDAAVYLGCSEANVYALISAGELPYVSIGRRKGYRLDRRDLEEFIDRRKLQKAVAPRRTPRPRLKHLRLP
jgi:excisionase family DNA binding protein